MNPIDEIWNDFASKAFPGVPAADLLAERGIVLGGIIGTISYITAVQDPDAMMGRIGEVIKAMQETADVELKSLKDARKDLPACYDGSPVL